MNKNSSNKANAKKRKSQVKYDSSQVSAEESSGELKLQKYCKLYGVCSHARENYENVKEIINRHMKRKQYSSFKNKFENQEH